MSGRPVTLRKRQRQEAEKAASQEGGHQGLSSSQHLHKPDAEEVRRNLRDPKQELHQEDAQAKLTHIQSKAGVSQIDGKPSDHEQKKPPSTS